MNNKNKSKKRTIRAALGLPDDDGRVVGLVEESSYESCENTMTSKCGASKCGMRSAECGMRNEEVACRGSGPWSASGGATSPNTEVNAENQGVIDEVQGTAQYQRGKTK